MYQVYPLIILCALLSWNSLFGYTYNPHVDRAVWDSLTPYFLPEEHPIKRKLDRIFKRQRATEDQKSQCEAGFKCTKPQRWTQVVVTKHSKVPGYIFKFYLDSQKYHQKQPEYVYWKLRIDGANLIRKEIERREAKHLFKVPKKWIYPLPKHPSPSPKYRKLRKNFILVEEDMDILSTSENERRWGSEAVDAQLLAELYGIVTRLALWDCCKPANIPFSRDGRVAFVDTQSFHRPPPKYHQLTPFLNEQMREVWLRLQGK